MLFSQINFSNLIQNNNFNLIIIRYKSYHKIVLKYPIIQMD
jgi:hypothetical protein